VPPPETVATEREKKETIKRKGRVFFLCFFEIEFPEQSRICPFEKNNGE